MPMSFVRAAIAAVVVLLSSLATAQAAEPAHGVAIHGAPKYGKNFTSFDYVNPEAPKGGDIRLATSGTFDNLNPFILKGTAAPGVGLVYQTLMEGSDDEAFSQYGQIAESIEIADDRNSVLFSINPRAVWQDGKPITANDVVWTFDTLMRLGHPHYRAYYAHVKNVSAESYLKVRFTFDGQDNNELPLILGQLPILPQHYWIGRDFATTTLEPPLGSGPYKIKSVDPGRSIVFERVQDWWAKDIPVNKGQYNFDTLSYELYRDETVLLEAFFSGNYDFRSENIAKSWATQYDRPQIKSGLVKKEEIEHDIPAGMQSFVFNTRRPFFSNPKVREALNYAFDFEWSNATFAYGAYKRTASFFENSELASSGLPEGRELALLEKYRTPQYAAFVPAALFTTPYTNPVTDGSGKPPRANLAKAKKLLEEAGWQIGKSGWLESGGKPFKFEFLMQSESFERWIQPFLANLKKLGIDGTLRYVDSAQFQNRMDTFDFDVTTGGFGQSLSPGNEQIDFWASVKADVKGSRNIIGVKNPAIDDLITLVISAPNREELIARTRALDRVLLWNHYVIPNWYHDRYRIAYWNKFGRPEVTAKYSLGVPSTWWYDADKAAKITQPKAQ